MAREIVTTIASLSTRPPYLLRTMLRLTSSLGNYAIGHPSLPGLFSKSRIGTGTLGIPIEV